MEVTRHETAEDKRKIKNFCDKLLFNRKLQEAKEKNEEIIPSLVDYHYKQVNKSRISIVKNLQFPPLGKEQLMKWFKMSADTP